VVCSEHKERAPQNESLGLKKLTQPFSQPILIMGEGSELEVAGRDLRFSYQPSYRSSDLSSSRSSYRSSYQSQSEEDDDEYAVAEEKFLVANTEFFETLALENMRRDQYAKLAQHNHVYMDYASLALSSRFQVSHVHCCYAFILLFTPQFSCKLEMCFYADGRAYEDRDGRRVHGRSETHWDCRVCGHGASQAPGNAQRQQIRVQRCVHHRSQSFLPLGRERLPFPEKQPTLVMPGQSRRRQPGKYYPNMYDSLALCCFLLKCLGPV
jgi:hypothetical protein